MWNSRLSVQVYSIYPVNGAGAIAITYLDKTFQNCTSQQNVEMCATKASYQVLVLVDKCAEVITHLNISVFTITLIHACHIDTHVKHFLPYILRYVYISSHISSAGQNFWYHNNGRLFQYYRYCSYIQCMSNSFIGITVIL